MAWQSRKNNNYGRNNNRGNQQVQQSTRKETTSENVTNRDFVVICADKSGRVATFAENTLYVESYSEYYNDTKSGMFEQLRDVLAMIPENCDEIIEKQVAIYVPGAICFQNAKDNKNLGDMYRSDKYAECQDIMLECADMLTARNLNCFLVDITGSQATIVRNAYDFVKEESRRANAKASGKEYVAKAKTTVNAGSNAIADKIAEIECKIADAIIDGNDDLVAKLESALARLQGNSKPATQQSSDELANVEL